jgi:hypothetical protein
VASLFNRAKWIVCVIATTVIVLEFVLLVVDSTLRALGLLKPKTS